MFTKVQAEIMKVFVAKLNKRFSIREIAKVLKKPYPLIHRSIKKLLEENFLVKDEKAFLSLNYKANHLELSYIEALRAKEKISKDKITSLFVRDVKEKMGIDYFTFLVFGSYVEKNNPKDVDVLVILENEDKINYVEKMLVNVADNFTKSFHVQIISAKSAYEMLAKRDKVNILNETLNKHLLLFGAENYYRILQNAR
jgi:predicted nucleotidyltransferase